MTNHARLARETRRAILQIVAKAERGHVGAALSIVEIVNVLFEDVLKYDSANPSWRDRDRLVLSKGHGCITLYVALARKGFFPSAELDRLCRPGGILGGHPDHRKIPGIETSTGSLGHGLAFGVGTALAARIQKRSFRTFVILGDGECNEGSVWEAALHAGKHSLERLFVIVDANGMQSFDVTSKVCPIEPLAAKWESFGFATRELDGHDPSALMGAFEPTKGKPTALICRTVKGKGVSDAEHNPSWHHKAKIAPEDVARLLKELEDS